MTVNKMEDQEGGSRSTPGMIRGPAFGNVGLLEGDNDPKLIERCVPGSVLTMWCVSTQFIFPTAVSGRRSFIIPVHRGESRDSERLGHCARSHSSPVEQGLKPRSVCHQRQRSGLWNGPCFPFLLLPCE